MDTQRACRACGTNLTAENQQPSCGRICRPCFREYNKAWNRKRYYQKMERYQEIQRNYTRRLKCEVISHYSPGATCARCGFDDIRALSIDHIDGGGSAHRRSIKRSSGQGFYQWLKTNDFPDGFQVLCMNCQFIKREEKKELSK